MSLFNSMSTSPTTKLPNLASSLQIFFCYTVLLLLFLQYLRDVAAQEHQEIEIRSFTFNCSSVQVTASLNNPPDAWEVTPIDNGLVGCNPSSSLLVQKLPNKIVGKDRG